MNMTDRRKRFLLTLAAVTAGFVAILFLSDHGRIVWAEDTNPKPAVEQTEPVIPESLQSITYTAPHNIYLPEMMFLVVKDTDSKEITRCKNMAYRTVDSFSRQENSNLVRADKKLRTLARIAYGECINVVIDIYRQGENYGS